MAKQQSGGRKGRPTGRAGRGAKPAAAGTPRATRSRGRSVPVKPLGFGALAITLAGGLGWFALWAPRAAEVSDLQATRAQLDAELIQLKDRVRSATEAQAEIATVEAEYGSLLAAIPEPADVDGLVAAGTEAAAAAGVTLLSTTPLPAAAAPSVGAPLSVVGLDIAVRGAPEGVTAFVNRLERLPRLVVVDGLALGGDGSGQVTATVSIRAFHSGSLAGPAIAGTTEATTIPGQPAAPDAGATSPQPGPPAAGDPAATVPPVAVPPAPEAPAGATQP